MRKFRPCQPIRWRVASSSFVPVSFQRAHSPLVRELRSLRRADGGWASSSAGESEIEPTAVASLALADPAPARWLAARQTRDGGFVELDGRRSGPATVALGAIAVTDPSAAGRALASAVARRGLPPPNLPQDVRVGWGWTEDARSLVEPTARVLIAVRALSPSDRATRDEAIGLLAERRCADGGWNYGNSSHLDVDLRSYAQTTAVALIALRDQPRTLTDPALAFLRRTWRLEPGALTTAQALIAFRLYGIRDEIPAVLDALARISRRPSFAGEPLAVAWAALATAPSRQLEPLGGTA